MVPYADAPHAVWSGFYTSRPNLKGYIRDGQHNLMASTKLTSMKIIDQTTNFGGIHDLAS